MSFDILTKVLAEQGTTGIIVICFIALVFWTVKKNDKMQDKLYSIIDTLSRELPEIKETLNELKSVIDERKN